MSDHQVIAVDLSSNGFIKLISFRKTMEAICQLLCVA